MTSSLDTSSSTGDRARGWAYQRDFWPGIVGYAVVLSLVLTLGGLDGTSGWRYVWAVLPVVPALWVVRAVLRHVGRVDDYQRLLLLQGLGTGFAVAMIAALTVGFLGIAGLDVRAGGWFVYGAGMLGWALAGAVAHRR